MVESSACNFYVGGAASVPAVVSTRSRRNPLHSEQRRSGRVVLLGLQNYFQGYLSRIQRMSACKCQSSCNSLRLGAAEEGVSSWEDKLESTSTEKGSLLEGESDTAWRDRIVDEEGNIDNIEQEPTGSLSEEEVASEQCQVDQGACADNVTHLDDISIRDQDQTHPQHNNGLEASMFAPTLKNLSQTMEGSGTARPTDRRVMAEQHPASSTTSLWPGEDGVKLGDKGEAIVDNVHVFPSHSEGGDSPAQSQERVKYGSSEVACDKGSLSRTNPDTRGSGNAFQKDRLQEEEDKVFQVDDGRTPDDYQRRANLFGKSSEQFVAQKHKNERGV